MNRSPCPVAHERPDELHAVGGMQQQLQAISFTAQTRLDVVWEGGPQVPTDDLLNDGSMLVFPSAVPDYVRTEDGSRYVRLAAQEKREARRAQPINNIIKPVPEKYRMKVPEDIMKNLDALALQR